MTVEQQPRYPDCGGRIEDHNAVNRVPNGLVAHSGQMGTCWKSLNTPFVELVRAYLLGLAASGKPVPPARRGGSY